MTINEENFATQNTFDNVNGNDDTNRRSGDGKWCGNAWGYNVYYSESSSINITLKLFKFTPQQQQQQLGISANSNNFSFRLTYKFLKRTDAKLR